MGTDDPLLSVDPLSIRWQIVQRAGGVAGRQDAQGDGAAGAALVLLGVPEEQSHRQL